MPSYSQILAFASANATVLLAICFVLLLILFFRRPRHDNADKLFIKAGLRVDSDRVEQLRQALAMVVADAERYRVTESMRHKANIVATQVEKERIIHLLRTSPRMVKEVGEALQAVEKEFKEASDAIRSERGKEVLRIATEREITNILGSVDSSNQNLPPFRLGESRKSIKKLGENSYSVE